MGSHFFGATRALSAMALMPCAAVSASVRMGGSFFLRAMAVLVICWPAAASTFYVDAHVTHPGNGTNWSQAWKSLAAINWSELKPGDTVLISGGTGGLVYRQALVIRSAGAQGKRIRIARADVASRNGPVTIDGHHAIRSCVVVDGFSHITIENLSIRNCTADGFRIRNATDIVASGNAIFALSRGFHIWRTSEATISSNRITTPTWTSRQTDGIYSEGNARSRYLSNRIVISNGYPDEHDDGIQSYRDRDMIVSANYVKQDNKKTSNALGIFFEDSFGVMRVVNNIVVGRYTNNSLLSMLNVSQTKGILNAYNNTLVGGKWGVIQIENAPNSSILNNIIHSTTAGATGIVIAGPFLAPRAINYNLYYVPNGKPGYQVNGLSYGWSNWRYLGYEKRGVRSPKAPIGASLAPLKGSLAIDAGLSGLTNVDQLGRRRPQGRRDDIGALERPFN